MNSAPEFRMPAGDVLHLNLFVRTTLDGATADIDLPASYSARSYPMALGQQFETALAARLRRPLDAIERALLHMALVGEWRRRQEAERNARLPHGVREAEALAKAKPTDAEIHAANLAAVETRRERSDWLVDYQDGRS